jgi:hypothetical protein
MDIEASLGEKDRVATPGTADIEDANDRGIVVIADEGEKALVGSTRGEALDYPRVFPEIGWITLPIGHG